MLMSEEELSVEIAQIDGIEIDDVDFSKASKDEVLQQFASNTSCADHEDFCLGIGVSIGLSFHEAQTLS